MKRGQITPFLIVGIILFIFLLILLSYKTSFGAVDYSKPSSFQHYIESCLKDTATFALFQLGLQGGYIDLPIIYFTQSHLTVAYAWNNGNRLASLQTMEEELATFVNRNFLDCVNNGIQLFKQKFGNIEYQEPKTEVFIQQEDVRFQLEFPVTIISEDATTKLEKPYTVTLPVRLALIHETVQHILAEKFEDRDLSLECKYNPDFTLQGIGYE
ncbi:hypothetical protein HYS48_00290, partial [Candidatus Woesearchaeota archaeon]|nr:hypothetical protein [Candidatus Woesearchaeota archaeon]